MRKRATFAVLAAATVLGGLAAPAAQADDVQGETRITNVVVNGGKDIVVGTTKAKTVTATVTATDASGIEDGDVYLWRGADPENPDGFIVSNEDAANCVASSATTSTCSVTLTVDPAWLFNTDAGTWKVGVWAWGADGDYANVDAFRTTRLQRYSKLTANASPEPVKKGATLTVSGNLTRANWDTQVYAGYTNQPVKLQFRKAGTDTYSTVKTVYTGSGGALRTTVTASADGYWRWNFAGTSTTPAAKATGDYVDVQ
ncbi:calcium-binding protein [Streptomyces sp. SCUT-3]|uniref:DUF5707 domain-containing protein n=1 Tax=Streptomyces sp. SCUT-3 TaxID=2684469 RepID=UPI000CC5225B|nr:DUF5707 domain-containing protein [Streptomyces sp. SCUT-3]PLW71583.1 calcium-binding protein [Streptomyces sp. DJ]QMV22372.1 calcium-binding protein [Streptomyces sp. SCUT-3]